MKILCAIDGSRHSQWVQAGCGKTISARQNFDGLHVWDNRTRLRRIAERDERGFDVQGFRNFEPGTSNFELRIAYCSRLALHAPWTA